MKKIIAVIAIISCVLLASCAGESVELDFPEDDGSLDFGGTGIDFAVIIDDLTETGVEGNIVGYARDTFFAAKAAQRLEDVEKALNCKINTDYELTTDLFKLQSASGTAPCDAVMCNTNSTIEWAKAGYLTGVSTLSEQIDYLDSAKWGSPNLLEATFYGDDLFGVIPAAWPELSYSSFGYPLVANIDLIRSLGAGNPREYVENGTWNWDTFKTELDACTVTEGERTIYGMITHYPYMAQMFLRSNGVSFAEKDADGNIVCGYYTEAGRRALEYIKQIYNGEYAYCVSKDGHDNATVSMNNFIDGVGCFTFTPAHCIFGVTGQISAKMENFAILPTPYGPDVEPGYNAGVYHSQYYCLSFPVLSDKNEAAATVINMLFEPFDELETYDSIKDFMTRNYFFDDTDADVFFEMRNNSVLNYDYQTGFLSRKIPEDICTGNLTVAELLDKYRDQMTTVIEETVKPIISVYDVLFE